MLKALSLKKSSTMFLLMAMLLMAFAVAPAFANPTLADGEYKINFTVLKDGTSNASTMDGYAVKPAKLIVENGQFYVETTWNNASWIPDIQVDQDGDGVYTDADLIGTSGNTKTVGFEIADLSAKLETKTHVVIPFLFYDSWYEVQIQFDESSIAPY